MHSIVRVGALLLAFSVSAATAAAQEKSVKPGINETFRDPNVPQFQGRFETESREVFARRKEILAACALQPGQVVADLGAGTGLFTRLFAETVGKEGRVFALDISQKFLDHIEKTSQAAGLQNVEPRLCTADSLDLPPESIDVAFICDTYHHFEFPFKTMAAVYRALKTNGRLIVVDFRRIPGTSTAWVLDHVRAGQDVVTSEIIQSGFRKTREPDGLLKENYLVEFTKGGPPGLKPLSFPVIAGYGGVAQVANAVDKPQAGLKVLFDITAASAPQDVNQGLERVARLLNLYGAAGLKASDLKIAVVLHGDATKSVLNEEFYRARFQAERNPNEPLIRELQKAGVEILVCGQALNFKGFPESAVLGTVSIAESALTVNVNKQAAGYGRISVP